MSKDTEYQEGAMQRQLSHDSKQRTIERIYSSTTFGGKSLAVLNGGGVIATLGFIQSLIEIPSFTQFKPYGVSALAIFLIGSFLASIISFGLYQAERNSLGSNQHLTFKWRGGVWVALGVSALLALLGGVLIAAGIYTAL